MEMEKGGGVHYVRSEDEIEYVIPNVDAREYHVDYTENTTADNGEIYFTNISSPTTQYQSTLDKKRVMVEGTDEGIYNVAGNDNNDIYNFSDSMKREEAKCNLSLIHI